MFIIFDLDGTIANTDHRQHFLQTNGAKKDWRAFYAACVADTPHKHVIETLRALMDAGHDVEIWSGRSKEVEAQTIGWLAAHGLNDIPIRMREDGDYTPDDVLKKSWLDPNDMPDLIFDDRTKVVNMWREMGIHCFHVAPGDF